MEKIFTNERKHTFLKTNKNSRSRSSLLPALLLPLFLILLTGKPITTWGQEPQKVEFTTVGTTNWTAPAGTYKVQIECWGGGAGGNDGKKGNNKNKLGTGGTGGGAGAYTSSTQNITCGTTYGQFTIEVGNGGNAATAGGASKVSGTGWTTVTANGGAAGGGNSNSAGTGGAGGSVSNSFSSDYKGKGGDGGAAGATGNSSTAGSPGSPGNKYGGGGGGGGASSDKTPGVGGAGAQGAVRITYWTSSATIVLHTNGGTLVNGPADGQFTCNYGQTYGAAAGSWSWDANGITRNGCTFGGWYADEQCTQPVSSDTRFCETSAATINLYVKWTPNTYTVTFETNGGTINSGSISNYTFGTGATLPTDVTKTNYLFLGWSSTSQIIDDKFPITTIGPTEYGNKTFYAQWTCDFSAGTTTVSPDAPTICSGSSVELTPLTKGNSEGSTVTYQWSHSLSPSSKNGGVTVHPTETTTYTVTATVKLGDCSIETPVQVTVTVLTPQVTLEDMADQFVCNGDSATLTASVSSSSGTLSYVWSPAEGLNQTTGATVKAGKAGTYTVEATASASEGACSASDTKSVTVTIGEKVTMHPIEDLTVCHNQEVNIPFGSDLDASKMRYSYTSSNTNVGGLTPGTATSITTTLTNETGELQTTTIQVVPHYTDNGVTCDGDPVSFTITVNALITVDNAGKISDSKSRICSSQSYIINEKTPAQGSDLHYSWKCYRAYNGTTEEYKPEVFNNLDAAQFKSDTVGGSELDETGFYYFHRSVYEGCNAGSATQSEGEFQVIVLHPADNITANAVSSNYNKICEGGVVELTADTSAAETSIPSYNNPTQLEVLKPISIDYVYSYTSDGTYNDYQSGVTPLEQVGTAYLKARFHYQNYEVNSCYAYSEPIEVVVKDDPKFSGRTAFSVDPTTSTSNMICPASMVTITPAAMNDTLSMDETNGTYYPFYYRLQYLNDNSYQETGSEATYEYVNYGKTIHVSNFLVTGTVTYKVVAENALGCSADGTGSNIFVTAIAPPTVSKTVNCPSNEDFTYSAEEATGSNELRWYADATTTTYSTSAPTQNMAEEGIYVVYVSQYNGSCESARVPDTLVVRYTGHIESEEDNPAVSQTVCQNSDIESYNYILSGDAVPQVNGLPEGVTSNYNEESRQLTISGTPTQAGVFNVAITLNGHCTMPTTAVVFNPVITVNPIYDTTVYFAACGDETYTVTDGQTTYPINTIGTHLCPLKTVNGCDSVVHVVYTNSDWNRFGYEEEVIPIATWTSFNGTGTTLSADGGEYSSSSTLSSSTSHSSSDNLESHTCAATSGISWQWSTKDMSSVDIVLNTSTTDFANLKLSFDYKSHRFVNGSGVQMQSSVVTNFKVTYSLGDGLFSDETINYTIPYPSNWSSEDWDSTAVIDLSTLNNRIIENNENVKVKITVVAPTESGHNKDYFAIDNICLTGQKTIKNIELTCDEDTLCTNAVISLSATPPFVNTDGPEPVVTPLTYTWEKIVNGSSMVIAEGPENEITDDEIPAGQYEYVVRVGRGDCMVSDTISVLGVEPTYTLDIVRHASICAMHVDDLSEYDFEESDIEYVEGMAIRQPLMDELRTPGVYRCWLNIPSVTNLCGDSIIILELTVLKSFDTTIVENICLGTEYHKYGIDFVPTQAGDFSFTSPSDWKCSTGCDSIYRVTLIVSSINQTINPEYGVTLAAWNLDNGTTSHIASCGRRSADATFNVIGDAPLNNDVEGRNPSSEQQFCFSQSTEGALRWPNLLSSCEKNAYYTPYTGERFEIGLKPKDFNNLFLQFDYKRENDLQGGGTAFDKVNYSYRLANSGDYVNLGNDTLKGTDWTTKTIDFSSINTLDEDIVYLKLEFTGGTIGNPSTCRKNHSMYYPSYITIDNVMIKGDKPARVFLSSPAVVGETEFCEGGTATFVAQTDTAMFNKHYFDFYLTNNVNDDRLPFETDTLVVTPTQPTDYSVVVYDRTLGCDSVLETYHIQLNNTVDFPATVEAPIICSGVEFSFAPQGDELPAGLVYTWENPTCDEKARNIAETQGGFMQSAITGKLENISTEHDFGNASYTVTPQVGECQGHQFTLHVTVIPTVTVELTSDVSTSCPSTSVQQTLVAYNVKDVPNRRVIWTFNGVDDTIAYTNSTTTKSVTLPFACGDFDLVATYLDSAHCRASDTVKISAIDNDPPTLNGNWPSGEENLNLSVAEIPAGPTIADVTELFSDNCGFTVDSTHILEDDGCRWTMKYCYDIYDYCNNHFKDTVTYSGGDFIKPTYTHPADATLYLTRDGEVDTAAATLGTPTGLSDNSGVEPTFYHIDTKIDSCGIAYTLHREWHVVDGCHNDSSFVQKIEIIDTITPMVTGTVVTEIFLEIDSSYDLPDVFTTIPDATGFNVTGVNINPTPTLLQTDTFNNGSTCGLYVVRTYQVEDTCNNNTNIFTHKINVSDTLTPRIAGNWADSTVNMDADGHYVLPEPFTSVSALNALRPGFIQNCNIRDDIELTKTDTTGVGTCGLQVVRKYTVTNSCNERTNTFTHTIAVADTVKPVLASATWTGSTVYLTIDATYDLPPAFTTIEDVNGEVADFIKGNNLVPELTVKADTQNVNTCHLQVVRTYIVTNGCNHKTDSFTHKIVVEDTLTPRIAGDWADSTVCLTNACDYTLPDTFHTVAAVNEAYAAAHSGSLFIQGVNLQPEITMADELQNAGDCDNMHYLRTYTVKDSCSGRSKTFTHKISVKDTLTPRIAGNWADSTVNMDADGHYVLPEPFTSVSALNALRPGFIQNCNIRDNIELPKADTTDVGTCGLLVVRKYTVTNSCNAKTNTFTHTIYIGDTVQPEFASTTWEDSTVYQKIDATYDLPTAFETINDVNNAYSSTFVKGNNLNPTLMLKTENFNVSKCDFYVLRTYIVEDTCNHKTDTFTHKIKVEDTLAPAIASATWEDSTVYLTIDANYNLPTAFTTIEDVNGEVADFIKGNNLVSELTVKADTQNVNTCSLQVVRTYIVTDSCNHKTDSFTHTIEVEDTLTPRIAGNWTDSTVYLSAYNACDYTLPDTLKTVAEVNDLVPGFIQGVNLNPAITMTAQVVDSGACGTSFYFLRTYTVTDTCSKNSATFTHKISVSDTTKPVLTGTWPANSERQNHIYAEADTSVLKSDADIKELFGDCHEIIVTHTQAPTLVSNCGWTIERTYHIVDACGNSFDSTMSVSGGNRNAPMQFIGTWPGNREGQNNCLANADTSYFLTDAEAAARFTDTCGVYVTHKDSLDENHNDDCGWTWIRTYTVQDSCHNIVEPKPTISISGSDQTAPQLAGTWPSDRSNINKNIADIPAGPTKDVIKGLFTDCTTITVDSDCVVTGTDCDWTATFRYTIQDVCGNLVKDSVIYTGGDSEAPTYVRPNDTTLYLTENGVVDTAAASLAQPTDVHDNYTENPMVSHIDREPTDVCGNTYTFERVWRVVDDCGNVSSLSDSVQTITVEDTITPRITGTAENDTVYYALDGTYQLPAQFTLLTDATSKGITVSGNNIDDNISCSSTEKVGEGTCGLYVLRTYQVKDLCNDKTATFTHKIVVKDTLSPRINGNWEDSTVYVSTTGCGYTLPTAFTSVEQVNGLSAGFISGINLKNHFEESDIDVNEFGANTCNHYVVRTYTVTDSCSQKTNTFSHKIWIKDTVAPVLTAAEPWKSVLDTQKTCSFQADTNVFYADEAVKDLFTDYCNDVIVSHTQEFQATGNCEWKFTRTYTISDSCGNSRTMVQTLPGTATGEHNAPQLSGTWTDTLPAQNACFAQADLDALYDEAQVKALCTDACSFEVTVTFEDETISDSDCGWSITRTYTISNDCGDTILPKPTMTIMGSDQTAPVLADNWPGDVAGLQNHCLDDADLSVLLTDEDARAYITDCSENITITHTDVASSNTDCGWTITRTYTVQDACGNTLTPAPTMSVSGKDQTAPVLTGVWLDGVTGHNSCFADVNINTLLPTNKEVATLYEDNCGGSVIVTSQDDTISESNRGWEVVRTYTIKDACGNETTNTMSVSGSDQSAPVPTADNWPNDITDVNSCSATADTTRLKSDDDIKALYTDCSDVIVTHTQTLTENNCAWIYTRTYTIVDTCGNQAETRTMSMSGQATAEASTPALVEENSWPANITDQDNCMANADLSGLLTDSAAALLYQDACSGIINVTHNDDTAGNNRDWMVTRTYTITNGCGGSTSKTMSVSGKDNSAPARTSDQWPADITNQSGCISAADRNLFPTADSIKSLYTDCTPITVTFEDEDNPTVASGWTITRTYIVSDSCGNTVRPVVTMSGSDQTAPVLAYEWPANITRQDNLFANAAISVLYTNAQVKALFTDCSEITVDSLDENVETSNCGWTITRTYTVKDACGNVVTPAPTMSVSGSDQTPPALINADSWFSDITDVTGSPSTADTSGLKSDADVAVKFHDNSDSRVTVSHIQETFAAEGEGAWEIRRTYTIADACGNETTKKMSIFGTITSSEDDCATPVRTDGGWPTDITDPNNCLANADITGLYSDVQVAALFTSVGGVVVTHTDDTTEYDDGSWTIKRTYTVQDVCGNHADGNYTMSVSGKDQTAPTLVGTWPDDVIEINSCFADVDVNTLLKSNDDVAGLYVDNCGGTVTVTSENDTVSESNRGWKVTRKYKIEDANGNYTTRSMSVSGSDRTAPTLLATDSWPEDITEDGNSCKPEEALSDDILQSDDEIRGLYQDCSDVVVTHEDETTGTNCDWTVTRTYTIKDTCGNVVTPAPTMSLRGGNVVAPEFERPKDTTLYLTAGCQVTTDTSATLSPTSVTGTCSNEGMEVTYRDSAAVATCGAGYTFKRVWRVVDACGNVSLSDSVQTITVADTNAPVLAGQWPNDVMNQNKLFTETDLSSKFKTDSYVKTLFSDCSNLTVTHVDDTLAGSNNCGWGITRTYTITDDCDKSTTATMRIGGKDQTAPVVASHDLTHSGNTEGITYTNESTDWDITATDNNENGNVTITCDLTGATNGSNLTTLDGVTFNLGKTLATWTMTDACGNVATCVDTIKINNNKPIVITSGSKTWDYDGNAHTFPSYTVTFGGVSMPRTDDDSTKFVLSTGDTLSVTPSASVTVHTTATQNNTFTYVLQNDEYYTGSRDSTFGTINVNGYSQSIQIASAGKTWTYDGQEHRYQKYTVEFDNNLVQPLASDTTKFVLPTTLDTLTITSTASITNVGKETNTFTYTLTNDAIYVGPRDTVFDTLRVIPLTGVEVKVVGHFDTAVYNGQLHTVTGYELSTENSLYNVADVIYNGTEADTTATRRYADKTEMTMTQGMFANNNPNFADMVFNITQGYMFVKPIDANIQITAESAEKNYDGTPLTNDGFDYTMTGSLVAGDTIVATVEGSRTEVGSSANVVTAYYVLRKTSATTFDTITNCYTFADPATVNGLLKVNAPLTIAKLETTNVDCYGHNNGKAVIAANGGKLLDGGKYAYSVTGPDSYSNNSTVDTFRLQDLKPGEYTVTVKDGLDSTVAQTFTISQPDTMVATITAPIASCPNQGSYNVSVAVSGGNGTNAYVWGSNATDADAASTIVAQIGASDCGHEYTAAVQVTDAKGCVAKDTVKFTVVDNEAPTFTAPANITLCRNADGQIDAPTSVTGVPSGYSDNCSNEATLIRHTQWVDLDTTGNVNTLMVIQRQWTVKDSCGNSTEKVQSITIKPGIGVAGSEYVLTAPQDIEITLKYGQVDTLLTNIGNAEASSSPEGIAIPEITDNRPDNNRYPVGVTEVVWTATDECGFTVTDTQKITVNYPPCDSVTYHDYEYPAVRIGGNCWLAENLHNTQYADDVDVANYSSYNNDGNMTSAYGLLYSWYSAVRVAEGNNNAVPSTIPGVAGDYVQGLCPDGWALPKEADYNALVATVGTTDVLKDTRTQYWLPGAAGTTPNAGFNARAAGYYDASVDRYMNLLGETYFWTSDAGATVTAGMCSVITHYCPELINYSQNKNMGFSVRCIRKFEPANN